MHQLQAGRPPSLLPFDSLLLPYPVTSAWRRQIAEAHSLRYVETSTVSGESDQLFTDVNRTGDSVHARQIGLRAQATEGERTSEEHGDGVEATGALSGKSGGRVALNIGFIGHDFDEHPTAHMIEGVFVWQKRLAGIKYERTGVTEALVTAGKDGFGERPAHYRTLGTAGAECCR